MKKISILMALMFVTFCLWGQDDGWIDPSIIIPSPERQRPYYIRAIPYNNYSFNREPYTPDSKLDILGWSRDGKILVFSYYHYELSFYIVDLVEDTEIDLYNDFHRKHGSSFDYAEEDIVGNYIKEIAKEYKIESSVGVIGEFPYITSDGKEYDIFVEEIDTENNHTILDAYIYQKFPPNKMKLVNTIGNEYGWQDDERGMLKFWYARSPFENRIAVIPVLPRWISGVYEEYKYFLKLYGSNLDVGFNLNMQRGISRF
jgi:hypothetical protein